MEYLIFGVACLAVILLIVLIVRQPAGKSNSELSAIRSRIDYLISDSRESAKLQREELSNALAVGERATSDRVSKELEGVRQVLDLRLGEIKGVVDEKLSKTLDERLDSNFKQIADSLSSLYGSLRELNALSGGIQDLSRTLSNVKAKGIWGERQLGAIIEQTIASSQYDTNVITKAMSSDRVEFAIKIPCSGGFVYLPIDSKMPTESYERFCNAQDKAAEKEALRQLEQRIKDEAKRISSKYIDPPHTTDFAIMFLPTESLYAQVLSIPGLADWCQTSQKIMIAGPSTITALLNSLRVGFTNIALNEKSAEVLRLLMAVKTQYVKFGEQIESLQKRLSSASQAANELRRRSDIIGERMSSVSELDDREASRILGIIGGNADDI